MLKHPPAWSQGELAAEVRRAEDLFRTGRLASTGVWSTHFLAARTQFEQLFLLLDDLASLRIAPRKLAEVYTQQLGDALRYLAGPPISSDDLKKLADVASLSPAALSGDPRALQKVLRVVTDSFDTFRFPWVDEKRKATSAEKSAALLASAALMAAQKMATARRNDAKREQEDGVKTFLSSMGFSEVRSGAITTIVQGPGPTEFAGESLLGTRKADVVVRLHDTRLLAIECKVSNSAINSVKRVNNDAAAKAEEWSSKFGTDQIVPAAVLSGVYKVENLLEAQRRGLHLFWAHDLERLRAFIESTHSVAAKKFRARKTTVRRRHG